MLSNEDIGRLIKKARELKSKTLGYRYTGQMLADDLNISRGFLGDMETGRTKAPNHILDKIIKICDLEPNFFKNNSNLNVLKEGLDKKIFIKKAIGESLYDTPTLFDELEKMSVAEQCELGYNANMPEEKKEQIKKNLSSMSSVILIPVPILGVIRAGEPMLAEQNIIGYEYLPEQMLNGGEYFGLRVTGDSMNNSKINDGDIVIVHKQPDVENGEIAVVLVDDENATVKKFYKTDTMVTLVPDSTNKTYQPRFIDITKEMVKVLGKVIKVIVNL